MRSARGFTLIEIVVVMAIIAALAAIVGPNLFAGSNRGKDFEREAATLAARIRTAQDDAMLSGREYGIVFTEQGYRFVHWDAERFRFVAAGPEDGAWTLRQFDHEVRVSAAADGDEPILVLPEPPEQDKADTGADADADADAAADAIVWEPSVFVLSSGEVTPFTAVFSAEEEDKVLELRIDALGNRVAAAGDVLPPEAGVADAP